MYSSGQYTLSTPISFVCFSRDCQLLHFSVSPHPSRRGAHSYERYESLSRFYFCLSSQRLCDLWVSAHVRRVVHTRDTSLHQRKGLYSCNIRYSLIQYQYFSSKVRLDCPIRYSSSTLWAAFLTHTTVLIL